MFQMKISKKDNEIHSLNEQLVQAKNEINNLNTSAGNFRNFMDCKEKDYQKVCNLCLWFDFLSVIIKNQDFFNNF